MAGADKILGSSDTGAGNATAIAGDLTAGLALSSIFATGFGRSGALSRLMMAKVITPVRIGAQTSSTISYVFIRPFNNGARISA
jgi:hypothetical protein